MTEFRSTPVSLTPEAIARVEVQRASYRPNRITTLFVGESAPVNGTFFYDGNSLPHPVSSELEAARTDEASILTLSRHHIAQPPKGGVT